MTGSCLAAFALARKRPVAAVMTVGLVVAALVAAGTGWRLHLAPERRTALFRVAGQAGCPANPAIPKRQFRAMWIVTVTNIDWPSREGLAPERAMAEYVEWLELARSARFNAVIVQVRDAGGVLWPSDLEPWSQYLTGVRGRDPGWDPLAFLVAEAHRRDLEFHAWFNPYRASATGPGGAGASVSGLAPTHPLRQHPEWAAAYPTGSEGRLYYNPGVPAARRFVERVVTEVVERYDIDAVHFDDYFYPYPKNGEEFPDDAAFQRYGGGFRDRAAWRRQNVNLLIKEVSERVAAIKPWVKFGVSPFGIWRNRSSDPRGSRTRGVESYNALFADTRTWISRGWLDYVAPQLYVHIGHPAADYATLVEWWARAVAGTGVQLYIGQGAYKPGASGWDDPRELSDHLALNRRHREVVGDIFFSAKDVRQDRDGAVSSAIRSSYRAPALVPSRAPSASGLRGGRSSRAVTAGRARTAGRQRTAEPLAVTRSDREPGTGAITLTWIDPLAKTSAPEPPRSYVVYRLDGAARISACSLADATALLATTRDHRFVDKSPKPNHRYTYVVTSIDRYGVESLPSAPRTLS